MTIAELCGLDEPDTDLWLPPEVRRELGARLHRLRPSPRLPPPRLVVPVPIDPTGRAGPTRGQSRGPHWRRTAPNRFVPADAEVQQPAQRIREVADLLPPVGGVTGWAALHLWGARWFDGTTTRAAHLPVELALGPGCQRADRPGVACNRESLSPDELAVRHGVRCLIPERAVLAEMRRGPARRRGARDGLLRRADVAGAVPRRRGTVCGAARSGTPSWCSRWPSSPS